MALTNDTTNAGNLPGTNPLLSGSTYLPTSNPSLTTAVGQQGDIVTLTNLLNSLNQQWQTSNLQARTPDQVALETQSSKNIGSELSGSLPPDVLALIQQQGAERGITTGSPGGDNANAAMLRALGLTSLGQQEQGQTDLTMADARNPAATPLDVLSLLNVNQGPRRPAPGGITFPGSGGGGPPVTGPGSPPSPYSPNGIIVGRPTGGGGVGTGTGPGTGPGTGTGTGPGTGPGRGPGTGTRPGTVPSNGAAGPTLVGGNPQLGTTAPGLNTGAPSWANSFNPYGGYSGTTVPPVNTGAPSSANSYNPYCAYYSYGTGTGTIPSGTTSNNPSQADQFWADYYNTLDNIYSGGTGSQTNPNDTLGFPVDSAGNVIDLSGGIAPPTGYGTPGYGGGGGSFDASGSWIPGLDTGAGTGTGSFDPYAGYFLPDATGGYSGGGTNIDFSGGIAPPYGSSSGGGGGGGSSPGSTYDLNGLYPVGTGSDSWANSFDPYGSYTLPATNTGGFTGTSYNDPFSSDWFSYGGGGSNSIDMGGFTGTSYNGP